MYRPVLTDGVAYTEWGSCGREEAEIPKLPPEPSPDLFTRFIAAEQAPRIQFDPSLKQAGAQFCFSQTARNFVSVFLEDPPCLDVDTLRPVPSTKIGRIATPDVALSLLAGCAGELYLWYWLIRGDGFHVTKWMISDFGLCLNAISPKHLLLMSQLGALLHERRNEAVVFKKNAGKYVGNYNYQCVPEITRRADLVLLAGLGANREEALAVFEHVQRVLGINVSAGEKGIPAEVKALVPVRQVHVTAQRKLFTEIDRVLAEHYGFTDEELDFIINYDIKYRMGGAEE